MSEPDLELVEAEAVLAGLGEIVIGQRYWYDSLAPWAFQPEWVTAYKYIGYNFNGHKLYEVTRDFAGRRTVQEHELHIGPRTS